MSIKQRSWPTSAGPRVHVAFEEGTQAQWLHGLLMPHVELVIVCNVRGQNEGGNKDDRIDVDRLSQDLPMVDTLEG